MKIRALALAALLVAVPSAAFAQPADDPRAYEYKFLDDLLNADGLDGSAPRITVRPMAGRERLLRPRVHFVNEMLRSVEKI